MNVFFRIFFGGLVIFFSTIGIFSLSERIHTFWPKYDIPSWGAVIEAVSGQAASSTLVNGLKRFIRYNANEEEDLVFNTTIRANKNLDITAKAYVVKNLSTGQVVAGHESVTDMPIASLTKLVTAIVARKVFTPNQRITITKDVIDTYGNTGGLRAGEIFAAEDLLYPLLMVSSNDAGEAFARAYGRKQFIRAMNDFCQEIGAYRTYFSDASGLSPANVSTAVDIAIILNWIRVNDPGILAVTEIKTKTMRNHTWVNPAHFLNWSNYAGGKNGYTPEANRTGAAIFNFGPERTPFAVVVLGSDTRDADLLSLLSKIKY